MTRIDDASSREIRRHNDEREQAGWNASELATLRGG